jgi:hypothetical protein
MTRYSLESNIFTIAVHVDKFNRIIFIAPIARRFRGQFLGELISWLVLKKAAPILHYLGQ